jgi:hypothetical protein
MASQGGNKGSSHGEGSRSEDTEAQNAKDEAVSRDPDIGGVMKRTANDVHMRGRKP